MTQVKVYPSGMPVDATHLFPGAMYAKWYKFSDGVWKYWCTYKQEGQWVTSGNTDTQMKQLQPR